MKKWLCLLIVLMAGLLPVACGSGAEQSAAPQKPAGAVTGATANAWDELVKAAQKEGAVMIYATAVSPVITPLREAFNKKYGINIDVVDGRPPEILARLAAEKNAGLYVADIGSLGETTSVMDVKPQGITVPLDNLLVLPEVRDPGKWIGGRLPYLDQDKHVILYTAMAVPPGVVNTDLVKPGALGSWLDILKPEWKGKIVFSDPSVSGSSPNILASWVKIFGKPKALEMMKQLADQEPAITRDQRLLQEWVARGKYAIGLGPAIALITEFKRAGAPIEPTKFKEPRHISGGPGNIIVFAKAPHPKAAQLYANWILSPEGSSLWCKALGYPSSRNDVTVEGLDPNSLPSATDVFPDEEQMQLRMEMRNLSAEVFAKYIK